MRIAHLRIQEETPMSSDADVEMATEVMTVYMALDGGLHHARCNQRLSLHGQRAGLELDFYCLTCTESVTIPFCVVDRIPVADAAC
jgi:hypothetical protein